MFLTLLNLTESCGWFQSIHWMPWVNAVKLSRLYLISCIYHFHSVAWIILSRIWCLYGQLSRMLWSIRHLQFHDVSFNIFKPWSGSWRRRSIEYPFSHQTYISFMLSETMANREVKYNFISLKTMCSLTLHYVFFSKL